MRPMMFLVLSYVPGILQTAHLWANTGVVERGVESWSCGLVHAYDLIGDGLGHAC